MTGLLTLCATPIGNLGDAPPRLHEVLEAADVVYAEDTRRSQTLLAAVGVQTPLRSYFAGNEADRASELEERLRSGAQVALLTDAGTPSVADPGVTAVAAARAAGARVSIVPGPSAATAALAVSGLPADRFAFEGFLPRKGDARRARLSALAHEERTAVVFVSPHRLEADLSDLAEAAGADRSVCVCRELTKLHEEVWWGTLGEAAAQWVEPRGEFTLVIAGAESPEPSLDEAVALARTLVEDGLSPSAAARRAASLTGAARRQIYDRMR